MRVDLLDELAPASGALRRALGGRARSGVGRSFGAAAGRHGAWGRSLGGVASGAFPVRKCDTARSLGPADDKHLPVERQNSLDALHLVAIDRHLARRLARLRAPHDQQRPIFARGENVAEFVERHRDQRTGVLRRGDRLDAKFLADLEPASAEPPANCISSSHGLTMPNWPMSRAGSHCDSLNRCCVQPTNSFWLVFHEESVT